MSMAPETRQHFVAECSVFEIERNIFKQRMANYEGCSNMNASGFITFFTYMLRQNGKRFYKGLYVTFKVAPEQKKKYSIFIKL